MAGMLAWFAHLYTATGAVIALLATAMTFAHNFRAAFLYLVAATIVDATDGVLARAVRVKERLPHFDGALLDNLVDYLTYVFVPIHYLYPSRMRTFKAPTVALGTMWGVLFIWMLWRLPAVGGPLTMVSFIFPAYYLALSLWLQFRR